jgi:signal transduction histidine kinase
LFVHDRHWIRIAGPLLIFAAVGTLGMILLLNSAFRRFSHSEFVALAETDADFIRDTINARRAEDPKGARFEATNNFLLEAQSVQKDFRDGHLAQLRDVDVVFQRPQPPDARHEAVTVPIQSGTGLTLVRERPRLGQVLIQPISLGALTAFWALWLVLAWSVTVPCLNAQRYGLLGFVATSLAHEIRNPIAAIRLHGQLLEQTEPSSAGLIVYEASKIEDMLNQWMFLARPEPPRRAEIALEELIEKTVRVLDPVADHAEVKIVFSGSPSGHIQADTHRLGQVFHNIILNAIQAMPEGGTLSITVAGREICFADTGPGFSRSALRRAARALYSEREGGMGLGLNIARKIVRAHNGRLVLGNRAEGGAAVRVIL